jgi:hypothetical protein
MDIDKFWLSSLDVFLLPNLGEVWDFVDLNADQFIAGTSDSLFVDSVSENKLFAL